MATLATIRTRVLAKLAEGGGSVAAPTSAQVTAQINSVIDFYESNAFWFNEAVETGTLTTGDATLAVPADFLEFREPNSLVVQQADVRYPIQKITPLQYDSMYAGGTALPRFFTYRDGEIQLYFPPDQDYTYFLYYRKSYDDLSADADTNDFTTYAERLIEYKTLADCYLDYRSDPEMASFYEKKVDVEFRKVKNASYERTATGNLTTENIAGRSRTIIRM